MVGGLTRLRDPLYPALETPVSLAGCARPGKSGLENRGIRKRAWESRPLRDAVRGTSFTASVLAFPVCHPDHREWPLWLVVARRSNGKPWYLLTSEPVETAEQAWAIVFAYVRRWQIELVFKHCKSELSFHASARVGLARTSQAAGSGYPGLCLLTSPALGAVCACAALALPLRLSPHWNSFASRPCPFGSLAKCTQHTLVGSSSRLFASDSHATLEAQFG